MRRGRVAGWSLCRDWGWGGRGGVGVDTGVDAANLGGAGALETALALWEKRGEADLGQMAAMGMVLVVLGFTGPISPERRRLGSCGGHQQPRGRGRES